MAGTTEKTWVHAASIPFGELKSKDLEECVYWLLDAMGAKDLEWRIGGTGSGAADGGRDLEATFYMPSVDGEMDIQKWWVECKGREGTVEPSEVKEAIVNASAKERLDWIVIATNTQFSNPTRDWVSEWQNKNPRPRVKLWDHTHLERYLSRHPDVVQRLFAKALSVEGRLKAVESRFWNRFELSPRNVVDDLWKARGDLTIEGFSLFPLVVNEFAAGNIVAHPWGVNVPPEDAFAALTSGVSNIFYLLHRGSGAIEQKAILRAISYLLLVAIDNYEPATVAKALELSLYRGGFGEMPDEAKKYLLMPIVDNLLSQMQDVCSADCTRMYRISQSVLSKESDELDTYWQRFDPEGVQEPDEKKSLRIEKLDAPCVVGFEVGKEKSCPLFEFQPDLTNVAELFAIIERVAVFRKGEAAEKRKEEDGTSGKAGATPA